MFAGGVCDLCAGTEFQTVVKLELGRSMLSHQAVTKQDLHKVRCQGCGLCMNGEPLNEDLAEYYRREYAPAGDHIFYTQDGPLPRAQAFRDWMVSVSGSECWQGRCLEVGAGSGHLMASLQDRFPDLQLEGLEPSEQAAAAASQSGLKVENSSLETYPGGDFDIIFSVAVMEHVPSPTQFLRQIRDKLKDAGTLVLVLPTQEVPSYDVFFCDHLYHFGAKHVREFARKVGFEEMALSVGHSLMPNFAVHVFRATDRPQAFRWEGPVEATCCPSSAAALLEDLERLDGLLETLKEHRVAAFGLHEAYALLRAYSSLWDTPLTCGLSDTPTSAHDFPVFPPSEAPELDDVLLTLNRVHYPLARAKLSGLQVNVHEVFSSPVGTQGEHTEIPV